MKIEKLRENNKKKWIIVILIAIVIISTIALVTSRAKYKITSTLQIVNGSITYKASDFNMVAMYANGSAVDQVPSGTWKIDQSNSYCTTNGSINKSDADSSIKIWMSNNKIYISNMIKKNTKCFVYLVTDTASTGNKTVSEVIATLGAIPQTSSLPNFNSAAETDEGVYYTTDDDGITYYYRGAVTNNYVKFGKTGTTSSGSDMWWRIIRFNGDGSIRLIYDGTAYHANGTSVDKSLNSSNIEMTYFANNSNDNAYVGYMYGTASSSTYNATHANINSSNAKTQLETWYTNNLSDEDAYIDKNAGFCGDRSLYSGTGIGKVTTYYGAYNRLTNTMNPTFNCPQKDKDLYTVNTSSKGNKALSKPIGLITADEVSFAGGSQIVENHSYYLYNVYDCFTMTPAYYSSGPYVYLAGSSYGLGDSADCDYCFRPVINLKSGTILTGNGTQSSPYQVVG